MERNLLIVDDEWEIVTWLEEMFRYDYSREIGVYTARSGKAALELLNKVKFDVVLTDIHMPQMDGITLFHKVKENWPRCRTVFLTGYQNFEDVYQVFQHRDVRYVLKSERDEGIKKAVSDAFDDIETEMEEERKIRLQKEQQRTANIWLQKKFMQEALAGKLTDERIVRAAEELEIPLQIRNEMLVFLLRVDAVEEGEKIHSENLVSLLNENIPNKLLHYIYIQENRHIFLFIQSKEIQDNDWECIKAVGLGAVEYTQEIFKNTYGTTCSAVMKGSPVFLNRISDIAARMKQVMVGYVGKNRGLILQAESMEQEEEEIPNQNIIVRIPMLKSWLELGKQNEYYSLLADCAGDMKGKSHHDVYALEVYYSIATLLLQFINENHIYMQLAFKIGLYKLMKADEHESWSDAAQFLFDLSNAIFELLGDKENILTERALARVVRYIEEHLSEELPLQTLAETGGFNASYLSRLFKQTCNQTLTEYICDKRMKKAKKLLTKTDDKIQDISSKTGYISSQSFARAFRNYTGLSPAEYRDLHHQRKE